MQDRIFIRVNTVYFLLASPYNLEHLKGNVTHNLFISSTVKEQVYSQGPCIPHLKVPKQ
jgi:hypothetical protein